MTEQADYLTARNYWNKLKEELLNADTQMTDPENNTDCAPYPTLHILREISVDAAVATVPDTDAIYERNIATMNQLGHAGFEQLLGK